MDQDVFVVGRQQYVAQLELNEEFITVTLSVYKRGEDHALLNIVWEPRNKWARFMAGEEFIPIGVVKRAIGIWENFLKTTTSKALHKRKPKPAPKALQALRTQLMEALPKGDQARTNTLVEAFNRAAAKTHVPLPLDPVDHRDPGSRPG